jgi:very-long-chain (3R)-3-hydroxyacyl-CoA dehydratase
MARTKSSLTPTAAGVERSQKPKAPSSPVKNSYLLAYNAVSAALWAGVLYKTLSIGGNEVNQASKNGWIQNGAGPLEAVQMGLSSGKVYGQLEGYTRAVQSVAGLEVLHSLVGTYGFVHFFGVREYSRGNTSY